MIKRMRILACLGLASLSSPFSYSAGEDSAFAEFKSQQTQNLNSINKEFIQFKNELEEGFTAYKKAYADAYEAEKKQVKNIWGEFRPGNKKQWVQYDKKAGIRKSVDFDSGEVELEMIVDRKKSKKDIERVLKRKILALLTTSRREAFEKDRIAQAVEKKIARIPQVKTARVTEAPVMSPLIPESKLKNRKAILQFSNKLKKQAITDVRPAKIDDKKIVRVKFKIPVDAPNKSKQFIERGKSIAEKEKLPLTLVMAIMETESAFNPMARSGVPAYGLMQIVPRSAGKDATAYLFGKAQILSPSYLYDSDNNIEIGGAYLHILYYRYLKKIENPVSRLYCTIAAYNTGAGNVARTFTGNTNINKASVIINKMTPKEVYKKLRKSLPYKETQHYIKKVSTRMPKYQQL